MLIQQFFNNLIYGLLEKFLEDVFKILKWVIIFYQFIEMILLFMHSNVMVL